MVEGLFMTIVEEYLRVFCNLLYYIYHLLIHPAHALQSSDGKSPSVGSTHHVTAAILTVDQCGQLGHLSR
eukprot:Skav231927  [mRNA]  locus=scaffold2322:133619:134550:+ [translate_table: standard]